MSRALLPALLLLGLLAACQTVDRGDPSATLAGARLAASNEDLQAFLEFYRPQDRGAIALAFASSRGAGVTSPAALGSFGYGSPQPLSVNDRQALFDLAPPSGALLALEKLEGRWYICLSPDEADPEGGPEAVPQPGE